MTLEAGSTLPLSSLLPYKCDVSQAGKNASAFLTEYRLLTTIASNALAAFQAGKLEKFDSLVGENACHTRALKVAQLANSNLAIADRVAEITAIQAAIDSPSPLPSLKTASFQDFLSSRKLDIHLSKDEMFLVQAYLLTLTKEVLESKSICLKARSNLDNLLQLGKVSKSFAQKLESHTKHLLAKSCTRYISERASATQDPILISATSGEFIHTHANHLDCVPLFWTCRTILHTLAAEKIPVVFHAQFLAKDRDNAVTGEQYLCYDLTDSNRIQPGLQKPIFVIEGVVQANADELPTPAQWAEAFQKPADVFLANAAAHSQYPDEAADSKLLDLQDKQFEHYKSQAAHGFSLENPSQFFITHVFASRTDHLPL